MKQCTSTTHSKLSPFSVATALYEKFCDKNKLLWNGNVTHRGMNVHTPNSKLWYNIPAEINTIWIMHC